MHEIHAERKFRASRGLWFGLVAIVMVLGCAVGAIAVIRRPASPEGLLIAAVPGPPAPLQLFDARATRAVAMVSGESLVQRFTSPGGRVELIIRGRPSTFRDPDLGVVADPPLRPITRTTAPIVITGIEPRQTSTAWVDQGRQVTFSSEGLDEAAAENFIAALQPSASLIDHGYRVELENWSTADAPPQATPAGPVTTLLFVDRTRGSGIEVVVVPYSHRPAGYDDNFLMSAISFSRETIRPGVEGYGFRPRVSATLAGLNWWDEEHHAEVRVSAVGSAAPIRALAANLRFVDAATWERALAPSITSMKALPLIDKVSFDSLRLTWRGDVDDAVPAQVLCSADGCTHFRPDVDGSAIAVADLVIDGHWWHVERRRGPAVGLDRTRLRTSPPSDRLPSSEIELAGETWRAVDLGTKAMALRRGDQPTAIGRPVSTGNS